MEAGIIFYTTVPWNHKRSFPRNNRDFPRFIRASANLQSQKKSYQGPKPSKDWAADCSTNNDDIIRSLPIYVRGVSLLAVLFNGTVSDIAPVADASSSQARVGLLTIALVVTNISLTGLVWLSIQPKSINVLTAPLILKPLGDKRLAIIGGDTFSTLKFSYVSLIQ